MPRNKNEEKELKLLDWFYSSLGNWELWRQEAYSMRSYYEGKQWSQEEIEELRRLGQPVVTINHIWSKINSLVGLLLAQEPQIKCLPRGKYDARVSSTATSVIRYVFDINQVQTTLADVFLDMLTTGIGWVDVRINPFLTHDPILVEYVPFDEVIFDHLARRPDLSDARYVFRGRWIERELVEKYYPDAKKEIEKLRRKGELVDPNTPVRMTMDRLDVWYDAQKDLVFVLEAQYKEMSEEEVIWDGVQAEKYVPELHDELLAMKIVSLQKMTIPVIKRAILIGGKLIHEEEVPFFSLGFSLVPFVAFRNMNGNPLSLVSIVKDIQDEINKRRSKVLHYLQAIRLVAEEGAVVDPDQIMEELRRPDAFIPYRRGMNISIERDVELGTQHFQLMQEAINEMSLITGIYPDFVGQPTNARTGAALRVRILQSQNSVQKYFSAVEKGLKQVAERVLFLAKLFYSEDRIAQLVDENVGFGSPIEVGDDAVQVRNKFSSLRADIIIKVRPSQMTEREEQLIQLVELLKSLPPDLVMMSLDLLIDAFDIPQKEEVKKRFAFLIKQQLMAQQVQMMAQVQNGNGRSEEGEGKSERRSQS